MHITYHTTACHNVPTKGLGVTCHKKQHITEHYMSHGTLCCMCHKVLDVTYLEILHVVKHFLEENIACVMSYDISNKFKINVLRLNIKKCILKFANIYFKLTLYLLFHFIFRLADHLNHQLTLL